MAAGWPVDQDVSDPSKPYVDKQAYIGPCVIIQGTTRIIGETFYGGMFWSGSFLAGIFSDGWFDDERKNYEDADKTYRSSADADR